MREEIGFGSKCRLLPSAVVKGRAGCRLLAAAGGGRVSWSAPRGCRHRGCSLLGTVGKGTVSCRRGRCLRSAIRKKKRGGGIEMSASHSTIKIHIEIFWVLIFRAFNRCCAKFCKTGKGSSESIPAMEGNSNRKKVEEAATVVWQALHEFKVEILPEECQGQTVTDGLKRSSLLNSAAFKETEIS